MQLSRTSTGSFIRAYGLLFSGADQHFSGLLSPRISDIPSLLVFLGPPPSMILRAIFWQLLVPKSSAVSEHSRETSLILQLESFSVLTSLEAEWEIPYI